MKNPNGYGTIKKLSGNRRRPFAVVVTTGYEMRVKKRDISFLKEALTEELFQQVETAYNEYIAKQPKGKQNQVAIGYYEKQADAQIALAEYNKNPYDLDKRAITFQQVYEIFKAEKIEKMKPGSRASYEGAYKKCGSLYNMRMHEIVTTHMQNVVNEYADKSKSTQNNLLKLFHAIYKIADKNNFVEKDYSKFVEITSEKESKEKKPFTREEVQVVWDNLEWVHKSERKSAVSGVALMDSVVIMLYTGMRISELLELKAEDIHLEERWIDLRGTKTAAARRIVPVHKKIIPLIKRRIVLNSTGYIFRNNKDKKIDYNGYLTSFFEPMCDAFSMRHTPHECRHSFATYAAASRMNPILVKKIIGHSAQDLTQDTYTHAMIEDLVAEIDKYTL